MLGQDMPNFKYNKGRRDANEAEIIAILKQMGCSVAMLTGDGLPDLLVGLDGVNILIEIKSANGRLTPAQTMWHKSWNGSCHIATNPGEATRIVLDCLRANN